MSDTTDWVAIVKGRDARIAALEQERDALRMELRGRASDCAEHLEDRTRTQLKLNQIKVAVQQAVEALHPVQFILASQPQVAAQSEKFERGCPLDKPQVRAMQQALAVLRKAGVQP